jgi:hypothetical protein
MNNVSKEEYLRLIEEYVNDQYGDNDGDETTLDVGAFEGGWIPADPPAKERMKNALGGGSSCIDLTTAKKDKISDALYKYHNIKVGEFIIRIEEYHGRPGKTGKTVNLTMDVSVWEEVYRTPSGTPCKMTYRKNFHQDNKFDKRPWLNYFSNSGDAHNIPADTVVDVIRWMQALKRMTAFL